MMGRLKPLIWRIRVRTDRQHVNVPMSHPRHLPMESGSKNSFIIRSNSFRSKPMTLASGVWSALSSCFFNFYVPCDCLSFERGRSSTPICRPELSRFSASWYRSTDQPRDCVTGSASMLLSNWDGCCYSNGNLRTQILRKRSRAIINFLWILSSVERRILFNHGATPGVMCFLVFSFVFPLKFCGKLFQFKQ